MKQLTNAVKLLMLIAAMAWVFSVSAQDEGIEYGNLYQGVYETGIDPVYISGPVHGVVMRQDISVSRTDLNAGPATGRTYEPSWWYSSVNTNGGVAVIGKYTGHRVPAWMYHSYYHPLLYPVSESNDWLWYVPDALSMDPWRNTTATRFLYGYGGVYLWPWV